MAVTITVADVIAMQPTSLPDSVVQLMIDTIDAADACLDANNVPDATQSLLKLYAVSHMVYMASRGNVTSESSPTGASRSYRQAYGGDLGGSQWGSLLLSLDQYGCVTGILQNDQTTFIGSMGPGGRRGNIYPKSGRDQ